MSGILIQRVNSLTHQNVIVINCWMTSVILTQDHPCARCSMNESQSRALDLMIESVYKADSRLRGCAYNQECYDELMGWRQLIIDTLYHYKDCGEIPTQVSEAKEKRKSLVIPRSNIL